MKEPQKLPSLDALAENIRVLKAKTKPPQSAAPSDSGMAMRMGMDMVSAVAVGTGLGYMLDSWLKTSPVFLLLGLGLGAAAGLRTIYRAAELLAKEDVTNESDDTK